VANPLRLRVIAELSGGRVHVSELARRLGISRPLLYMHLNRLQEAGIVTGHLELSEDGKAMKYFELAPFELRLTAEIVTEAVQASRGTERSGGQRDREESDT
jgi:DNA-binding transcriptional ArsR family regulator